MGCQSNNNDVKKLFISWAEFHADVKALANMIKKDMSKVEGIVLVSRGGVIPAGILSYELDVKTCDLLSIASYDGNQQKDLNVIKLPETAMKVKGKNWVVIDELLDCGTTIKYAKQLLPESKTYVVYSKIKSELSYLNGYVKHTPKDAWIYLPWDEY